jgi:hypothetical protein
VNTFGMFSGVLAALLMLVVICHAVKRQKVLGTDKSQRTSRKGCKRRRLKRNCIISLPIPGGSLTA